MRYMTLLSLLLLACGGQDAQDVRGSAVPAQPSPTTTTPEGVTFTVPAGFSYEVNTEGTSRAHVMKSGSAGVVLAVFPFAEGTCQATFVTVSWAAPVKSRYRATHAPLLSFAADWSA